jgi:hypothetical protein
MSKRSLGYQRLLTILVASSLAIQSGCSDGPTGPKVRKPAAILIEGGQDQSFTVGKELPAPLLVRVVDEDGQPIARQIVNFKVTSGGGSVFAGAALTSQNGIAQERWTLGTSTAETQRVEVRAVDPETGAAIVFAVFRATPKPDEPVSIAKVAGDLQQAVAGTPLSDSLTVRVADKYGNPVPGISVTWAGVAGGGSLSPTSYSTTAEGLAKTKWTLGTQAGTQSASASSTGLNGSPATFTATALPGAGTLAVYAGNNQSAIAGSAVATPPSVVIRDANNNPLSGVSVTFAVSSGGGSVTGATQVTNSEGIAAVGGWTLGTTAGPNSLTATASGIAGSPVTFNATGVAGPAATIALHGGSTSGTAGHVVSVPPSVIVTDANGNPVAGVAVTFQITSGGGSMTGASQTTDANGIAAATSWTLGTIAGSNTVTASASGLAGSPVTIEVIGNPGAPAKLEFVTEPSNTGWRIAIAPSVRVAIEDEFSNVITSSTDRASLSLLANPGGATLTGGDARPFVNGVATFSDLTLDKPASGYTLRAVAESGSPAPATSSSFSVSAIGIVTTLEHDSIMGLAISGSRAYMTVGRYPNSGSLFCSDSILSAAITGSPPAPFAGGVRFILTAGRIIGDGTYIDALHDCGANLKFGAVVRTEINTGSRTFVPPSGISGVVGPDMEFDGTYFYLAAGPQNQGGTQVVRIVRVGAAAGDTLVLVQRDWTDGPRPSLAVSGGQLYFIDIPAFGPTIQRVSIGGGAPTTVVTGLTDVSPEGWRRLVIVGNTLYWAEPGSIRSAPLGGGTATTRVSGLSGTIRSMVSDGTYLYVNDGGSLRRIDLSTFSVTTIAENDDVGDIALDTEAVYWTTRTMVKKAPK